MKPATASVRPEGISIRFRPANRFRPEFYFVEFALRARTITTLGALATQFHEKRGSPVFFTKVAALAVNDGRKQALYGLFSLRPQFE